MEQKYLYTKISNEIKTLYRFSLTNSQELYFTNYVYRIFEKQKSLLA